MLDEQTTTAEATQVTSLGEATEAEEGAKNVAEAVGKKDSTEAAKAQETQVEKTYTEKELNERLETAKGGHKGTVDKMRQDVTEREQRIAALESEMTELKHSQFLARVEAEGGDVDAARQVIELQKQATAEKQEIALQKRQLAEREETLRANSEILERAGRNKKILDMVKEYELDEKEDLPKLLAAKDPTEMEAIALRLALVRAKAAAVKGTKVAAPGTSTKGVDLAELTKTSGGFATALGLAAEGKI